MAQDELGLEGGLAAMERNNGAQAAEKGTTMMADDKAPEKAPSTRKAAKAAKAAPNNTGPNNAATAAVEAAAADLAAAASAALLASAPPAAQPLDSKAVNPRRFTIRTDASRDAKLTAFGKETLDDRYLLPGETYQDLFARVADAYADDAAHAQRLYDYISNLWFMPATPVLSNGGTGRGLPISCYLNSVEDSLEGIVKTWNENVWLASRGGGIGTYWGNVRGIGENVGLNGKTSGIIPFVRVMDSLTLAISQGSLRRGSAACYLDISHPEIEEFLEIRKSSGDFNRKALNLHHGVLLSDEFMEAVRDGTEFALRSPKDGSVRNKLDARSLFQKLVEVRLATGEPYIVFNDTVNRMMPAHHRELGLKVSTSNLCSEITLPTGIDHLGNDRTAVCCLSSLNLETWDEWQGDKRFVEDVLRFLDNVLQDFIDRAPDEMARAKYSAARERSVGMGVMGFHSFLQKKGIGFDRPWPRPGTSRCSATSPPRPTRPRCCWPRNAAPAPTRPTWAPCSVSRARWRSRRPRRSRSSAAAPRPASSRSRPTSTRTRPSRARSWSRTPIWKSCCAKSRRIRPTCGTRSSNTADRSSIWSSSRPTKRRSTRPASRSTSAGCSNSPPTARPISTRRSR
jgi:ribonucleoside-diphosphate reductase alpha chain